MAGVGRRRPREAHRSGELDPRPPRALPACLFSPGVFRQAVIFGGRGWDGDGSAGGAEGHGSGIEGRHPCGCGCAGVQGDDRVKMETERWERRAETVARSGEEPEEPSS